MLHERMMKRVLAMPRLSRMLKVYSNLSSSLAVAAFALLFRFYLNISVTLAVKYLAILGIPFLIVSLMRRFIGAPRPYEVYDFFDQKPKDSENNSFPSRHAFSIFAIGVTTLFVYPVFGIVLAMLGIGLCVARVALGYHFPRDVITGGLIGIISSLIGHLFLL